MGVAHLHRGFRSPVSCLDIASLLQRDNIASVPEDHLTLAESFQNILRKRWTSLRSHLGLGRRLH